MHQIKLRVSILGSIDRYYFEEERLQGAYAEILVTTVLDDEAGQLHEIATYWLRLSARDAIRERLEIERKLAKSTNAADGANLASIQQYEKLLRSEELLIQYAGLRCEDFNNEEMQKKLRIPRIPTPTFEFVVPVDRLHIDTIRDTLEAFGRFVLRLENPEVEFDRTLSVEEIAQKETEAQQHREEHEAFLASGGTYEVAFTENALNDIVHLSGKPELVDVTDMTIVPDDDSRQSDNEPAD